MAFKTGTEFSKPENTVANKKEKENGEDPCVLEVKKLQTDEEKLSPRVNNLVP